MTNQIMEDIPKYTAAVPGGISSFFANRYFNI
jgi:hypothetical protein